MGKSQGEEGTTTSYRAKYYAVLRHQTFDYFSMGMIVLTCHLFIDQKKYSLKSLVECCSIMIQFAMSMLLCFIMSYVHCLYGVLPARTVIHMHEFTRQPPRQETYGWVCGENLDAHRT